MPSNKWQALSLSPKKQVLSIHLPPGTRKSFLLNPEPCFSCTIYCFPDFSNQLPAFSKRRNTRLPNVAKIFQFSAHSISWSAALHFSSWRKRTMSPVRHWLRASFELMPSYASCRYYCFLVRGCPRHFCGPLGPHPLLGYHHCPPQVASADTGRAWGFAYVPMASLIRA